MHIFRKHKQALLIFMFVAIGFPMLFFGVPWGGAPPNPYSDIEVANVAGVPIMASEFRRNLTTAGQRQARGGETPSFKELQEQGVASEVFEQMMTSALIASLEAKRGFTLDQSFLEDRLKEDGGFQDEAGNFNGARYNAWVKANKGTDWDAIYDSVQQEVSRQIYLTAQLASANRVLDADVEQELRDNSTKIQMEYVKVEPPVELTDADIQAYYDEHKDSYNKPQTYAVDYVAFSLQPEGPGEKVAEVLAKAKAGEDFAALADEYSDLETKNGGDLGDWFAERETELDYRKPLFALKPGEVSDPIAGPGGYYIYKLEEERTNEETQVREIKARHIYIKVALSDSARADLDIKANELAAKTKETNDLRAAATELGLNVASTSGFSVESTEIDGIPRVDAFQFRRSVDEEATREVKEFNVVTARDNIYVIRQVGPPTEGASQPLSDVRELVIDDAKAARKGDDAYKVTVTEYADKILAQAKTLDELKTTFPELDAQIKETRPFTKKEYLFQDQIYLQTMEIYDALEGKEKNAIAGPLTDFLGGTYFIALTNREEPTEEEKANWDEEGKALRDRMLASARYELTEDFTKDLQERTMPNVSVSLDEKAYTAILGLDDESTDSADETATPALDVITEEVPAADAPTDAAPAEAATPAEADAPAEAASTDAN